MSVKKILMSASLMFLLVVSVNAISASATSSLSFAPPQQISPPAGKSLGSATNPDIAVSGSYVYVSWEEKTSGVFHAYVAVSNDSGSSFFAPVDLNSLNASIVGDNAHNTNVAANGTDVYVAWANSPKNSTLSQIYISSSSEHGAAGSFSVPKLLSGAQTSAVSPQVAAVGSYAYVIWTTGKKSGSTYFSNSTNNGVSFSPAHNLGISSQESDMAAVGQYVYVIGDGGGFSYSTNYGKSFANAPKVTGSFLGRQREPLVAAYGNHVYAIWTENSTSISKHYQVLFRVGIISSTTLTWTTANPQVLTDGGGKAAEPQVAATGSYVYVLYRDRVVRSGKGASTWGMYFLGNNNYGAAGSWHNSTTVDSSNCKGGTMCGDISQTTNNTSWGKEWAAGNSVFLAWTIQCGLKCSSTATPAESSAWNVVVAGSSDNGNTFALSQVHPDNGQQGPIPAADAPPVASSPNGSVAYVAWQDNSTNVSTMSQVMFAHSA